MEVSEHAREEAFWSAIDDGPTEEEEEAAWFWDLWGHAESGWRE